MSGNKKVCRLCLLIVDSFEEFDELKLQMCAIVLSSDVKVHRKSVICNYCLESLEKSFDFKMVCLGNEEFLNTFLVNGNVTLILPEIIPKTETVVKQENQEELLACRLCFKYSESKLFTDLSRIEDDFFLRDMVENCLPEINVNSTESAAICQKCMQFLQNQFNLISTFVDTNDKINAYISCTSIDNKDDEVDLHKVLEFTVNIKTEESPNQRQDTKVELSHDEQLEVDIKLEEHLEDISKDEDVSYNLVKNELFKKTSKDRFSCNLCSHETTMRCTMILHQQKHQNNYQFKCDKCDFVSKWKSSLHQHALLHKESSKLTWFKCTICSYKTKYMKHLRRHNKLHSNPDSLTNYKCQYCKFTTTDKAYFKFHNKNKHKKNVVLDKDDMKVFNCDECDFVANRKSFLTKHCKRFHKKYVCEHCGRKLSSRYHLKGHLLTHKKNSEVTMLQCANCGFKTKYKNSLKSHLLLRCSKNSGKNK